MLERGLLQVYIGDGKGKTTAAVGQAVRARGAGLAVCFVQFVKGGPESSELSQLRQLGIEVIRPATATTGLLRSGPTDEDYRAAQVAWDAAAQAITTGAWDLVVLDELHAALHYHLLPLEPVLQTLQSRPATVEVVTTGRQAPAALREMAELITEMVLHKHPYQAGIAARKGIEY